MITLAELAKTLPKERANFVFDVDDNALFTSAWFQCGSQTYGPDIAPADVPIREEELKTPEEKQKYREIWAKMNSDLNQYSAKKWIADKLIAMHKSRDRFVPLS